MVMEGVIRKIVLTAENGKYNDPDFANTGTDVIVRMDNGDEYIATFISLQNMEYMIHEHKNSDERYKIVDAVLVDDYSDSGIKSVIEHMMTEGDFQVVFKKL
jgi:hypothetical protein